MSDPTAKSSRCRILFLLPQKARAARVAQLILEQKNGHSWLLGDVVIECLPAVAVFKTYKDEEGNNVKYLSSVDYFGPLAALDSPESLLPFFDEDSENKQKPPGDNIEEQPDTDVLEAFSGISGVALGPGIHEEVDVAKIQSFFQSMSKREIPMETIQPNPEFGSINDELRAFREMSAEERDEATRLRRLGPGKMAQFTIDFSERLVRERQRALLEKKRKKEQKEREEAALQQQQKEHEIHHVEKKLTDPEKTRYSCRKCRTILFGEDELEDPPHAQSIHRFSARKMNHGSVNKGGSCQSLFLQSGSCRWFGDMSEVEGRLLCPKCTSKVGTWHWSGAQCSCGTWVVPAIQIPQSKVDEIAPFQAGELPSGTVISPFAVLHRGVQS